ncbi:hypothetical protein FRC04_001781 [Tulasnella sp. 424]|nr:hypothetical protein FRC04_001781 [Tulasnella sp. 424]
MTSTEGVRRFQIDLATFWDILELLTATTTTQTLDPFPVPPSRLCHRGSRLPSFIGNIFRPKNQANELELRRIDLANRGAPLECQKGSKFIQLPEDILLLFSLHLGETAKARVVQTCRYLRHLLEPTLYVHLGPFYSWEPDRATPLHQTLVERPDLIQYIRSYKGPIIPPPIRSFPPPPPKRTLLNLFRVRKAMESVSPPNLPLPETEAFKNAVFIFTKATQIVDLAFTDCRDWDSDPIFEPIKAAVSKMSLNRLFLWNCAEPIQFLRAQPELEHLEIGWNICPVEGLEKADIPKLRSLSATPKEASYIVPGRPVEQFNLVAGFEDNDLDEGVFKSLALSTGPINKLSMCPYRPWDDQNAPRRLRIVSQNLPDLEELTITVFGTISAQVILDEIPWFQSLRRLAFLNANLAVATPITRSPSDESVGPLRGDDVACHDTVVNNWDELFRRLKILCPLLVEVERAPARQSVLWIT